jgi:endonuclease-3 related protein
VLGRVPRGRQKGPLLQAFAQWWKGRFGDELEPDWPADVEQLQQELRAIRGVSVEMADRLLLFVGRRPVFPVDRSAMRIACRHGWLDAAAEYEEWQSFFAQRNEDTDCDRRELSIWLAQIGRDFCGPQPRCEDCPLRSLLPPGGAYVGDE